ncbi:MAG: DUF1003 domain-containing protein [Saprospiraceae bacterium]|nr:DUF1003 domain-containing protein [Saprospiraceae bacterium]MCB9323831.1 DUF1003 domain-containing protein [Lewinellaceae bacterium]
MKKYYSAISKSELPSNKKVSAKLIRHSIFDLIQKDFPDFTLDDYISIAELNNYREKYVYNYVSQQKEDLSELEKQVLNSIAQNSILSDNISENQAEKATFGQRLADKVAVFGGSWTFIISFSVFIFIWIAMNIFLLMNKGFDPYPFILLNLILSCIASMQAPVIMMSQNRQEGKDRDRAIKDYTINLKSELEIRTLHEKMDHLILHQQQELMEMQKVQIEMMNDILTKMENK